MNKMNKRKFKEDLHVAYKLDNRFNVTKNEIIVFTDHGCKMRTNGISPTPLGKVYTSTAIVKTNFAISIKDLNMHTQ